MNRNEEQKLATLSPFEVKDTLMRLADENNSHTMINAGRGNPNWLATVPRDAFFHLGLFALQESKATYSTYPGFGGMSEKDNISTRFLSFCEDHEQIEGVRFLLNAFSYLTTEHKLNADELVSEWVEGILGDNYPVPDRMLKHSEFIARKYIEQEMGYRADLPQSHFDLFAVEGGTAAMVYIFNALKTNRLLNKGDTIAIGAPVFTPYLEMPELEDYSLNKVEIMSTEDTLWQISDDELNKLRDPNIKAFFLVNPSNPASVKLSDKTLQKIADIANERPDLILLTDDVYGTFTDNFTSLAMLAPKNTILVYSYSKYFGATGWRLGVIAINEHNIFDNMIKDLPESTRQALTKRYSGISLDPANIKFIDRLVADSRAVALNHTAGLSTPQQIQMTLFSLLALLDGGKEYQDNAKRIVRDRYHALMAKSLSTPVITEDNHNGAFYYVEINIQDLATCAYSQDFFAWMAKQYEPLDFLVRLAEENSIVVMPGGGFDAPDWSLRISLANLPQSAYSTISSAINQVLESYYQLYLNDR